MAEQDRQAWRDSIRQGAPSFEQQAKNAQNFAQNKGNGTSNDSAPNKGQRELFSDRGRER